MLNSGDTSLRCNPADIYPDILRIFYKRTLKNKSKNLSPSPKLLNFAQPEKGKMPEWSIGTVSKTVVPLRVPRVRIPVFPPTTKGCKSNDAQPFCRKESRDENPGRVRYREALSQRSGERIPVFPQISLITKCLQNLRPILHPEMAVILGVLLSLNDT